MATIEPWVFCSSGSAARTIKYTPRMLLCRSSSNRSSGNLSSSASSGNRPALATTVSSCPNCSTAVAIADAAPAGVPTSATWRAARPPSLAISETTSSTGSPGRPFTTTAAPDCAKTLQMASPMPVAPPVTIATLFAIIIRPSCAIASSSLRGHGLSPRPPDRLQDVDHRRRARAGSALAQDQQRRRGRRKSAAAPLTRRAEMPGAVRDFLDVASLTSRVARELD